MADNQVILEFLADTAGLQAAAKQMLALGTISKEQFAAFNKANQESEQRIKAVTKAQSDLDKAVVQTTKDGKAMNDSFRQLTATIAGEVLKEAVAGIAEMGAEMSNAAEKTQSLKSKLAELKGELNSMQAAGDDSSENFVAISTEAAKLQDAIEKTSSRIRALASDTKYVDALLSGVQGLAGGFSALQGAAGLLGKGNEDLQVALLRVNSAMALASGTQQVFNTLQKNSAFMIGLVEAKTIAYGTALRVVDGISKTTGLSMAASWGLATGGLTVLIGGIALLISSLQEAEEASTKFKDSFSERFASQIEAIDEMDKRQEVEMKKAKIRGEDLIKLEKRQLLERLSLITELQKEVEYNHETNAINEKSFSELSTKLEKERLDTLLKLREDASKNRIKQSKEQAKRESEIAIENLGKYELKDKVVDLEVKGLNIKPDEVTIDKVPEVAVKLTTTEDTWAEFMGGLEKAQPYIQAFAEATSLIFGAVREESKRTMDEQITALNKARDKELENKKLTDDQKAAINEKYRRQENKIKVENFEKDKQMRLAEASINGMVALTSLMKETPPPNPLFFVGAALIGLQTGLAIGMIAKEKAPAYEKGGKNIPGGMKLVGEKGPELIYTPGGETVIPHGDTARILEAWSIPMPKVPEGVKGDMAIGMAIPPMDYDRIGSAVAGALAKNPSLNVRIDGEGFGMHIVQKGRVVHLLNNDYRA